VRGACLLLDRFLPSFCPEFLPVSSEGEGESTEKKAGKRLEVPLWLMAWDNYSLAAAALDQVCFSLHEWACLHHSHSAYLLQMPFDVAVMHSCHGSCRECPHRRPRAFAWCLLRRAGQVVRLAGAVVLHICCPLHFVAGRIGKTELQSSGRPLTSARRLASCRRTPCAVPKRCTRPKEG